MAKIEQAIIERRKELPEWLTRAIAAEREKLTGIENPRERRIAEIELEGIESRTRLSLMEAR